MFLFVLVCFLISIVPAGPATGANINLIHAKQVSDTNSIQTRRLLKKYKNDSAKHRYLDAISAFNQYEHIKDSLFEKSKGEEIVSLQKKYQTEEKDKEISDKARNISLLTKQSHLQSVNLRQEKASRNLIIAGTILLLLLLGISYNRYHLKKRLNHLLLIQQDEINSKNSSLNHLLREKESLLAEKEWLIKEIHHRVKNNLQIVISLLNTQSAYLNDDAAFNAIRESQHRMQSISLIHQKLYQSENLALVDMRIYVCDLVQYLRDSFNTGNRIAFETDIAEVEFDVTKSVPLGLILNEAITNAIKYAFPANRPGKISISLKQTGEDTFLLSITDNGVGFLIHDNIAQQKSLGMILMRGLTRQIGGTLNMQSNDGLAITIEFTYDSILNQSNA